MSEQSQQITRGSASNLALAFVLLPRERRRAMSVLYAFCRCVDDVADDESVPVETRRRELARWRADVRTAIEGGTPEIPVIRELQPLLATYCLDYHLFDDLIRGVEMDLDIRRYETFADLELYCYRVASVVGLLSIEIFGHTDPACRDYAVHLGKALQLTNILRDVQSDAARRRIYLPLEMLRECGVTEAQILEGRYSENYRRLAEKLAARARHHYQRARELLPARDRRAMVAAELMGAVYWRLLCKLERAGFDVFGNDDARLSRAQKLSLIARTWFRWAVGSLKPNYGVTG
jgi:15-cis-phytoene synthase